MTNFERKFVVDPEGKTVEQKLSEEEKETLNRKSKLLALKRDRKFVVNPEGGTAIEGTNEEKLIKKDIR